MSRDQQGIVRNGEKIGERAVVIGGSMAGLLAARVLAERFGEVSILERDACPTGAQPRKGVPQGQHAHALLPRGQQILVELFPGLREELLEVGALRGFGRYFVGGGYLCRVQRGPGALYVSRLLLESEIRARVAAMSNVQLRQRCHVAGLIADETKSRICGVRLVDRERNDGAEIVAADLVVDAGGRGSRLDDWLKELGYPAPEVEVVEVGMGYATRHYRREAHHLDGDLVLNVAPTRSNRRASAMLAQEGNRWIVTLAGYFGNHPPTDEAGFLAFAKSLPTQEIYETIRTATPLDDVVAYKFPSNQRRRYERLARFPDGLLAIGDAICSFTPIYGQGMSVAAMEAMELRNALAAGSQGLGLRFFRQIAKLVDVPWSISAGNDRRLTETKPTGSPGKRLLNWYMDRLLVAARSDPEVAWAFLQVSGMLKPPPSVLHPKTVWRVLRNNLLQRDTAQSHTLQNEMAKA
jgi:2-polyprenyl-6-methoxyphenol hydroxylase-like FAD-dependent oxidoreductase